MGTKTSCTVVRGTSSNVLAVSTLPSRGLRWGILELEATGKWKIDPHLVNEQVDAAISDIQNNRARSFLGKIGVVNKYQACLVRNCGAPTDFNCRDYLDIVRDVLTLFEERLTNGAGYAAWLRGHYLPSYPDAEESDVDEAVQVWPLRLGGFGLQSFAPLALALEQRSNISDDISGQPSKSPDLGPRAYIYEKMQ